jgi:ribosomal-protein-serine acetyltransferase
MFSLRVDDEVALELAEEHHAEAIYALVERNRDHLRPWMPWADVTTSPADSLAYLRFVRAEYVAGKQFHCNVVYRGEIVGGSGMRLDRSHDACEIGYWLDKDATGKGIVTRTSRALTAAAFERLGMHRVSIRAGVENVRSRAVPERLGFTFEGVLRENERVGDRYVSLAVYSMLSAEWAGAGTLAGNDAGAS